MVVRYKEIADDLRKRIERGEFGPGDTLPGYGALSEHYGVGRGVIGSALAELEHDGLVHIAQKRGTTVRRPAPRRRVPRGRMVTRSTKSGYVFPAAQGPDERWTKHIQPKRSTVAVPERVAEILRIKSGAPTLRRRRVTSPEGEPPFQIVDTWIHPDAVDDAPQVAEKDTGLGGYLDRLEEAGHGPISWQEAIRTRMPTAEEARLLKMSKRMPVLEIARIGTSARTNAPIEVSMCVIPGDRVELINDLQRDDSAIWPVTPVTEV